MTYAIHPKIRSPCESDFDCIADWEYCAIIEHDHEGDHEEPIVEGSCTHKHPFPMFLSEFIGGAVIIAALVITQTGGIAGGGSLIPILLGFYRFDAQNAIAISNVSMGIGSAIRGFSNCGKSHPLRKNKGV